MYDKTDLRSSLAGSAANRPAPDASQPFGTASFVHFKDGPPQQEDALSRRWYARGHNFLVCYVEVKAGAKIARADQPDEYVVLAPLKDLALRVHWSGRGGSAQTQTEEIPGYSVVIVPAGASTIEAQGEGHFFLLFSTQSEDLARLAANAAAYDAPRPHVAPLVPWPDPVGGAKIRRYSMEVPDEPGRFGRIWRCTTFMVNLFVEHAPRDVQKVSPHYHDDFEQGSLLMSGTMSHHVRWPWTTNMRNWLADAHADCDSPSLGVIPPPAIHTSNGTGSALRLMVDVFSPPRVDFSQKAGWVLNAAEYPMPAGTSPSA